MPQVDPVEHVLRDCRGCCPCTKKVLCRLLIQVFYANIVLPQKAKYRIRASFILRSLIETRSLIRLSHTLLQEDLAHVAGDLPVSPI